MEPNLKLGRFTISHDQSLSAQVLTNIANSTYEEPEVALVNHLIRPGERVLEFGSGMGLVTMELAAITGATN